MTETVIVAIIGVAGTLLGGIVGTVLANSHARKQIESTRRFTIQDSARGLVVTALVAARDWSASAMGVSMAAATSGSVAETDTYLRDDFADSYSGQQVRENSAAFNRAVTELKLLLAQGTLRETISELQKLQADWWEQVISPIRGHHKAGLDKVERMRPWIKYEAAFNRAISNVEAAATRTVASTMDV